MWPKTLHERISGALVPQRPWGQDGLGWWGAQYLQHAVTTRPASPQVQHRDLGLFRALCSARRVWISGWRPPARTFQHHLRQTLTPAGHRAWSDKMIQRILAPLDSCSLVHTHQPCPLGHPIAAIPLGPRHWARGGPRPHCAARRRLLDAADLLLVLDALDGAATEALRRAVRGTSASGGCGEGRDTSPHMALDMAICTTGVVPG